MVAPPASTGHSDGDQQISIPAEPSTDFVEAGLTEGAYTVPESLRTAPVWLTYRVEGDRKVPKMSSPDAVHNIDPTKHAGGDGLTDYYSALDAIKKSKERCEGNFEEALDGVGLILGELPNGRHLSGFDLDDCVDETGVAEFAVTLVESLDSYAEFSPSGTGIHVLFYGDLDDNHKNRAEVPGDTEAHIEAYSSDRYFTFTGNALQEAPDDVKDRSETAIRFHRTWFQELDTGTNENELADVTDTQPDYSSLAKPDERLLQEAMAADASFKPLWEGRISHYESHSEADLALVSRLSWWCRKKGSTDTARVDRLFRSSALMRPKWERDDYRQRTLKKAHKTFR